MSMNVCSYSSDSLGSLGTEQTPTPAGNGFLPAPLRKYDF